MTMTGAAHRPGGPGLDGYGQRVECSGVPHVVLDGERTLWLLTGGTVDLFTAVAGGGGAWRFVGRADAGTALLGSPRLARHGLVARPDGNVVLRRLGTDDVAEVPAGARPALAEAVDRGVALLLAAGRGAPSGQPACETDAVRTGYPTLDLLADGSLWSRLAEHQARFLADTDRDAVSRDQVRRERLIAGQAAAQSALDLANRALGGVVEAASAVRRRTAAPAVATRLLAAATGTGPSAEPLGTREVRLPDRWWTGDLGPLVGYLRADRSPVALLPRRGGYDLVDPAGGRSRVTASTAQRLEPVALAGYRRLPDGPVSAARLVRFGLQGHRRDLARLGLGSLVSVGLSLLVPVITGQVLGRYVPAGRGGLVVVACAAVMLASLVGAAFAVGSNVALLRIEGRGEAAVQLALWDRLLRHPIAFFARWSTGELASTALGVGEVRRATAGSAVVLAQASLVAVVNFALLWWYSFPLGLVAAGLAAVAAIVRGAGALRQLPWQRRLVEREYELSNRLFHTLRGLPKLRVAGAENFAYAHWARDFAGGRELVWRISRIQRTLAAFDAAFLPGCLLVLFWLTAGPLRGSLSAAGFLTVNAAFGVMLAAMAQLTGTVTVLGGVVAVFERLRPLLGQLPENAVGGAPPGTLSGGFEVDRVTFRYAKDGPPVLRDVSLRVRTGEYVAIVGPTGCGKSTLLRLLLGFEWPESGSVRYDDRELSTLDQTAVRRQFGVVLQNARPLAGSILSTIRGDDDISLDDAWRAATLAGLADDIAGLPMGMHTLVTDSIATLSGGQRQRLMIARALARRPRVLFLDEATSALDNATQRLVADGIRELPMTRVVIAHRLTTIMQADRVIVLSAGRVVQEGTPAGLLADRAGLFYDLVRHQMSGTG